jgi:site-specific DNA recombinase
VVQQIFAWVVRERLTLGEVRRRLENLDEPSPSGRARWGNTTVAAILNNPAYQGKAGYGRHRLVPRQPRLLPVRGKPEVLRRPYSVVRSSEPIYVPVRALVSSRPRRNNLPRIADGGGSNAPAHGISCKG